VSKPKKAIPPESSDGFLLSKPWREHTPEEKEALYPHVQREADRKRLLDSHGQWVDSVLERHGTELIWIDVKGDSSEVAKIRRPAKLSFTEAIPELKLVDACPEVVEYVGTKGERLRLLVADPLSIEGLDSFASGTRLPSERRANRAQTVETAERAKAAKAKRVANLPKARDARNEKDVDKFREYMRLALEILDGRQTKKPSLHELAGLVEAAIPRQDGWNEGDERPTRKAISHQLAKEKDGRLRGKIKPSENRSRD